MLATLLLRHGYLAEVELACVVGRSPARVVAVQDISRHAVHKVSHQLLVALPRRPVQYRHALPSTSNTVNMLTDVPTHSLTSYVPTVQK